MELGLRCYKIVENTMQLSQILLSLQLANV